VNRTIKMVFAAAAALVTIVACSPAAVAPSSAAVVASSSAALGSSSEAVTPSPEPSSSQHAARLTVAGTDVNGPALQLTVNLPSDWQSFTWGAARGTSSPPAGMAFVVSTVDNTFADPCAHRQRSPKVGPTVQALATALGEVPNTIATKPVQTTIAGHMATYLELAIPASLPCEPSQFYLWQDSPDGDWWVQGLNETARVWIFDVRGQRVTFLAHSYPGSGDNPKALFQKILDSIMFDAGS
jgi:hypothetical protein